MAKKGQEVVEKALLGRPTNNVKIGVVGMPNVGKSMLFNFLSKQNVPSENRPFCTIDPNTAKAIVPDERFDHLVKVVEPDSRQPATLTITDIAGLVKGAAEGHGLGNAFLSHIGAVDALYHLVRAFKDAEVEHVEGEVDPVRDLEIISEELILKDFEICSKLVDKLTKETAKGQKDKEKLYQLEVLSKVLAMLEAKKDLREGEWNAKEVDVINPCNFLTAKPVCYLINVADKDFQTGKNKWIKDIKDWVAKRSPGAMSIPFSGTYESQLAEKIEKGQPLGDDFKMPSMLPKIIKSGYHTLRLVHYFTAGKVEVRAWTIRAGTKAPQAAGVIHTDFEKAFISAEIMKFTDYKELGSEQECRKAGKHMLKGREYVVEDGDICLWKVGTVAKK